MPAYSNRATKLTLAVDGTGVFDSRRIDTNNGRDWNFILSEREREREKERERERKRERECVCVCERRIHKGDKGTCN